MNVIYYSSTPGIAAQIASAIHLRLIPRLRLPSQIEWRRIPYRYGFSRQDWGRIIFAGRWHNEEVYLLSYPPKGGQVVVNVLEATLKMERADSQFQIVNCSLKRIKFPPGDLPSAKIIGQGLPQLVNLVVRTERGGSA
jgi:hypothetical protein